MFYNFACIASSCADFKCLLFCFLFEDHEREEKKLYYLRSWRRRRMNRRRRGWRRAEEAVRMHALLGTLVLLYSFFLV